MVLRRLYVPERRMTFGGHLEELRQRILYSIAAVVVAAVVGLFFFQEPLVRIVLQPHRRASAQRAKVVGFHKLRKANEAIEAALSRLAELPPEKAAVLVRPPENFSELSRRLSEALSDLARARGAENDKTIKSAGQRAAQSIVWVVQRLSEKELIEQEAGENLLVVAEALKARFERLMEERGSKLRGYFWKKTAAERTSEVLPALVTALRKIARGGPPRPGGTTGTPAVGGLPRDLRAALTTLQEGIDILQKEQGAKIVAIRYTEQFFTYLKVVLIFALFLASPFVLWQAWQFIAAGLYEHEQRVALQFVPFSMGLFLCGVLFGYFVLIPWGLSYLSSYGDPELVDTMLSLSAYLSLFLSLTLLLGIVFQVPLVMFFLSRAGLVEPAAFRRVRRVAILSGFILGALLTPPDPFTQLMLAGPLVVLYEIGILISKVGWRKAQAAEPQQEGAR